VEIQEFLRRSVGVLVYPVSRLEEAAVISPRDRNLSVCSRLFLRGITFRLGEKFCFFRAQLLSSNFSSKEVEERGKELKNRPGEKRKRADVGRVTWCTREIQFNPSCLSKNPFIQAGKYDVAKTIWNTLTNSYLEDL
jgi:hypothetical protein